MALFDFLKRKKEIEKARDINISEKKSEKVLVKKEKIEKSKHSTIDQSMVLRKKTNVFSYDIIKEPHISEKATILSESNHYVFKIYSNTNKIDIKKAVEGVYGVNVLSVNIIKIPKKKRRLGKVQGFKSGYAKAVVKIQDGQKIEII